MNKIQKILTAIAILVIVTSVSIATEMANISINENLSETNATESGAGQLNGNTLPEDMPAEEQNNASIASLITNVAYTNPVTGISVFGKMFDNRYMTYYDENYAVWTNYTFYLPISSYVYIDTNGIYTGLDLRGIGYKLTIDGNDGSSRGVNNKICNVTDIDSYCYIGFYLSQIFQLNKGYHNVKLVGYKMYNSDLTYDVVQGTLSITAFPEYTAIRVDSPNGGESWARGTYHTIKWTKFGNPGSNVIIELYKGSTRSAYISSKTSNDGTYTWYIPAYQPIGTDYKIKISSWEEPSKYYDWSNNYFRIY